nr:hypothetical protein [Enterovirga sp. DB1703]
MDSRPFRRVAAACLALGGLLALPRPAAAQAVPPASSWASLPSFARPQPAEGEESRWAGSFARMSTGFVVSSSRRFGSYAGPTVGFEGGRMWQDGSLVYGVVGGFDYLAAIRGGAAPGFGGVAYTRDFAGGVQVKVGTLVTPDVLVYAKAGASAVHETLRFGATSTTAPFTREDIVVRPEARVGVEWAVTDRITLGLEAGVVGPGLN